MNPKKRILKILSVFLSLIFLSSLACAAYAEYEESVNLILQTKKSL